MNPYKVRHKAISKKIAVGNDWYKSEVVIFSVACR